MIAMNILQKYLNFLNEKKIRSIWMWIEKRCIKGLDAYFTVSSSIADAYSKRYGIELLVIRNLPTSYDNSEVDISPKNLIDKGGHKLIIYQGSVNIDRGLEEMLHAMQFLPNFKLLVCGDGDILPDLIKLRDEMEWRDRIILTGNIALEKLSEFTIQADVGISIEKLSGLSYTYALPNKVFDYVQAGLPVLISSMPEVVKLNDQFGFAQVINEITPDEITAGMNQLFKSNEHFLSVKKKAEKAAVVLNWDSEEVKLLSVFERILSPKL
jgi:glycosyltransferase involved in cell wall biosynthesis